MHDYGHIDDQTPSFAISILKEYRNCGIGTALMQTMLSELKSRGYQQASLSVQKQNYAVRMYKKVGFQIIDEDGVHEHGMPDDSVTKISWFKSIEYFWCKCRNDRIITPLDVDITLK